MTNTSCRRPASRSSRHAARRLASLLTCALGLAACTDRPPTTPSPAPGPGPAPSSTLDFGDGRYLLLISGFDGSFDPTVRPCEPMLVPRGGKSISTFLWFTADGDGAVGRSRPPYAATLELGLQPTAATPLGTTVRGTVSGAAPDEYDRIHGKRDSTFVVPAAPAAVAGVVAPRSAGDTRGAQVSGEWRGEMRFVDSGGAASTCTFVQYYLQPAPPGGPDDDPSVPPIVPGSRPLELRPALMEPRPQP
jgi:hypothetical protein